MACYGDRKNLTIANKGKHLTCLKQRISGREQLSVTPQMLQVPLWRFPEELGEISTKAAKDMSFWEWDRKSEDENDFISFTGVNLYANKNTKGV